MIVNIVEFGAVDDGVTVNTAAIQNAIDHCAAQGGGTVVVPKGNYVSGTIMLRSYVELHLTPAARIVSSMKESDFTAPEGAEGLELSEGQGSQALVCARHAKNIAITGLGTIDGRGSQFLEPEDGVSDYVLQPLGGFRPKMMDFEGCTNVVFRDVTLYQASSWGMHMTGCNQVTVDGVKILGQVRGPNNDGIDPDSCKDVHISNCHIETGDDCIVIKTTKYGAERYGGCENITVTNCTLQSHDSAIKIGTETHADIRNIVVTNCVIRNSNRGVGIWVRDGATMENMLFSNLIIETRLFSNEDEIKRTLRWWGKSEPIFMTAERRNTPNAVAPGTIRNIRFDQLLIESEGCIYLEGFEEQKLEGISLSNVKMTMRVKSGYPGGVFDTQPSPRGVFPHHIPAIFLRNAKDVTLSDVEVKWAEERNANWSNALYGEQLEDLHIRGFKGLPAQEQLSVMELKRVQGLCIERTKALPGTSVFLLLDEVDSKDCTLEGNNFTNAATPVLLKEAKSIQG
ncbi:glycoside hydrolase family 28 protein [Paenibacillus cremeus]|uniref:Glycoside hydrolase family 28 protein n=1 Tax=Paenibacillus cremeus TaxID=2163881 RepID=A0A559KFU8_9BACL|nr:glycoside hydrolase family 28 protein [Paenibacillus cremeus]TVY11000.1 glycoside hydrolase family 28 protein [Paenibacillus cremeus]